MSLFEKRLLLHVLHCTKACVLIASIAGSYNFVIHNKTDEFPSIYINNIQRPSERKYKKDTCSLVECLSSSQKKTKLYIP